MPGGPGSIQSTATLRTAYVRVPTLATGTVEHPVAARLDEPASLTTVVAPGGAGKTTLLASWAQRIVRTRRGSPTIAWLTVTEVDDEPERFGQTLVLALRQARVLLGERAVALMRATPADPLSAGIPAILAELVAGTELLVIVIDDYQLLSHPSIHVAIEALIRHAPPHVRFVLSASQPPGVSRLGQIGHQVIGENDLRFTETQARQLLAPVLGFAMNGIDVAATLAAAQGRPAELLLAGLVARNGGKSTRRGHSASHELVPRLLAGMTADRRRFLLHTSVLDAMTAALCDAVLGRDDSADLLAQLPELVGGLAHADPTGTWYLYHPTLRGALKSMLEHRAPRQTGRLLIRAADWFSAAEDRGQAVRYHVAAGDHRGAAMVLAKAVDRPSPAGAGGLLALGRQIDRAALAEHGPLCLAMAASSSAVGDQDGVHEWLDLVSSTVDVAPAGWQSGRAARWALSAVIRGPDSESPQAEGFEDWLAQGREAVELEGDPRYPGWALSRMILGAAMIRAGDTDAIGLLSAGLRRAGALGVPMALRLTGSGTLALALLEEGRVGEARSVLSRERAKLPLLERDLGPSAAGMVLTLRLAEGRLAYLAGEFDAAVEALTRAAAHADTLGSSEFRAAADAALADVESARGKQRSAAPAKVVVPSTKPTESAIRPLTERERGVLLALAGASTQRAIAAELDLTYGQ